MQALMDLLGGHPALLEKVFSHLRTHPDVSMQQLLVEAPTESSLLSAHLRQQLFTLQSIPALAQAFQQVVTSEQPVTLAPKLVYQLQSMGLIKLSGNVTTPRCQLYQQYFRERLTGLAEQVS
ncbi:MAG: AAA-like domain-containing protein [Cyanobacteria bacterium P01_F01_bin.4]